MDIAPVYARFQREQNDAYDDTRKTRYDGFGAPIDNPAVEGFDQYGDARHYLAQIAAQKLARRQDAEHAHALALREEAKADSRKFYRLKSKGLI